MVDTAKKTIGENKYEVMHFIPEHNYALAIKFLKIVGASFEDLSDMYGQIMGKVEEGKLDDKVNFKAFGAAVKECINSIHLHDPKGEFVMEVMGQTLRNGEALTRERINSVFLGKMDEYKEVIIFTFLAHFTWAFPKSLSGFLKGSV